MEKTLLVIWPGGSKGTNPAPASQKYIPHRRERRRLSTQRMFTHHFQGGKMRSSFRYTFTQCLIAVLCAAIIATLPQIASAQQPGRAPQRGMMMPPAGAPSGSNDQRFRNDALRAIPFRQLNATVQAKLKPILDGPTLYRRMPSQTIECDPDMFVFLVRHPEVTVNIWQKMKITEATITRTGAYSAKASDGVGTDTDVELIYGTRDMHIVLADGVYEGPMFRRKMTGKCVLLLRSTYGRNKNNAPTVTSHLDVFMRLDNTGAGLLAKTMFPFIARTADFNFVQTAGFISKIHKSAEANGPGMERLAASLDNVVPPVRTHFAQLISTVSQRHALRTIPAGGGAEQPPRTAARTAPSR